MYHVSRTPFKGKFDESKIGSANDPGYSGRGFYFLADPKEARNVASSGYIKAFSIQIKDVYNLNKNDPFSEDTELPEDQYRDEVTLSLLKQGYDGSIRYLNNRIDEVCVFSFLSKGYDGNKYIKEIPGEDWQKI